MSLKVKYQYTHFIYPFTIENGKYGKFIESILKQNKTWKFKIREEKEDEESYNFFLPYMRKFLFPTLSWSDAEKKQFKSQSLKQKVTTLKNTTCATFELNMNHLKKGTSIKRKSSEIEFDLLTMKLICFEPGVCFIDIKTELEDIGHIDFSKILDFNNMFRNLNNKTNFDIKAKDIDDVNDIWDFVNKTINKYESTDLSTKCYDKMFTYSYVCLDKESWGLKSDFKKIKNDFYKYQYVIDSKSSAIFNTDNENLDNNSYSRWQFSEFGFSKESGVVLVSEKEKYNITKMPYNYEKKYLYMLLLAFYQRITLINFSQDLLKNTEDSIKDLKTKLTKFTHYSWFSQVTNSENGMEIWRKWKDAFELKELYDEVHREYLEYYEYVSTVGQEKINVLLIFLYTMSVIFAGFAIIVPMLELSAPWFEPLIITLIVISAASYPLYMIAKKIKNIINKYLGD